MIDTILNHLDARWVRSAAKPLTTRIPETVSSTTAASSADSCWTPTIVGKSFVEKRLAR